MESTIFRVLFLILELAPYRNQKDLDFKFEIAQSIASVTDSTQEQNILVRIGWLESGFNRKVASCKRKGDHDKSLGIYQVQPITKYDSKFACGTVLEQTKLALDYVHRSFEACPGNTGADLLAMYVSGTCQRGLIQAKHRWSE